MPTERTSEGDLLICGALAGNRPDDVGTIETGKLIDLVLLEANSPADISNRQKIAAVVANDRLFRREVLDGVLAEVAAAAAGR